MTTVKDVDVHIAKLLSIRDEMIRADWSPLAVGWIDDIVRALRALRDEYEQGVGDGIRMEQGIREGDPGPIPTEPQTREPLARVERTRRSNP